jgi:hypothetical protein
MVKGKKITKKQIKNPDEFISLTSRAIDFSAKHLKKIAFVAGAVLVILLAIIGFEMWEGKKERDAAQSLNRALELYQTVDAASREGRPPTTKVYWRNLTRITRDFAGPPPESFPSWIKDTSIANWVNMMLPLRRTRHFSKKWEGKDCMLCWRSTGWAMRTREKRNMKGRLTIIER